MTIGDLKRSVMHLKDSAVVRINVGGTSAPIDRVDVVSPEVVDIRVSQPQEFAKAVPSMWECPECHDVVSINMTDVLDVGSPVCGDCDCDMELQ